MTTKDFIEQFNAGNQQQRADLLLKLNLKDTSIGCMEVGMTDGMAEAFYFIAFPTIRAGCWYAKLPDDTRRILEAFRLYNDPEQTFNSWLKICPNEAWGMGLKAAFMKGFAAIVLPEYVDN